MYLFIINIYICLIKNDRVCLGNQFLIHFLYISKNIYLVIILKIEDISDTTNFLSMRFACLSTLSHDYISIFTQDALYLK